MKQLERSPTRMAPITKFVAVNIEPAARDALRLMAVTVSAAVGRRVSMSDALLVIDAIAKLHADQIREVAAQILTADPGEEPTP